MKVLNSSCFAALFFLCFGTVAAWPQGQLQLNTRVSVRTKVDFPIKAPDGSGAGSLESAKAQLMKVEPDGSLTPLFPATVFRPAPSPAQFYVVPVTVIVPDSKAGSGKFVLRAWVGASFAEADCRFESAVFEATPRLPPDGPGVLEGLGVVPLSQAPQLCPPKE